MLPFCSLVGYVHLLWMNCMWLDFAARTVYSTWSSWTIFIKSFHKIVYNAIVFHLPWRIKEKKIDLLTLIFSTIFVVKRLDIFARCLLHFKCLLIPFLSRAIIFGHKITFHTIWMGPIVKAKQFLCFRGNEENSKSNRKKRKRIPFSE